LNLSEIIVTLQAAGYLRYQLVEWP